MAIDARPSAQSILTRPAPEADDWGAPWSRACGTGSNRGAGTGDSVAVLVGASVPAPAGAADEAAFFITA